VAVGGSFKTQPRVAAHLKLATRGSASRLGSALKLRHAWHIEARLHVAEIKKFFISHVAVGGSLKTQPRVATHRKLSTRGSSLKLRHTWHIEARLRVAEIKKFIISRVAARRKLATRGSSSRLGSALKLRHAWHEAGLRVAEISKIEEKFIISRVAVGGSFKTQPRVAAHQDSAVH